MTRNDDGSYSVVAPYGRAAHFNFRTIERSWPDGWRDELVSAAARQDEFMIGGERAGSVRGVARRRSRGEAATIVDAPRLLLPFDVDGQTVPEGLGSPQLFISAAKYFVSAFLPSEFRKSSFIVSPTSSTGIKSLNKLNCRIWFMLSAPASSDAIIAFAQDLRRKNIEIDPAIYRPAQPIYLARPVFLNCPDPISTAATVVLRDAPTVTIDFAPYVAAAEHYATAETAALRSSNGDWREMGEKIIGGAGNCFGPLTRTIGAAVTAGASLSEIQIFVDGVLDRRGVPGRYGRDWVGSTYFSFQRKNAQAWSRVARLHEEIRSRFFIIDGAK